MKPDWPILCGKRSITKRRKRLLYHLKERREYGKFEDEALDLTLWENRYERGYGLVLRQTTEMMMMITMMMMMMMMIMTTTTMMMMMMLHS